MSGLVDGQVVVVTGASSGIGRAVALTLAREGAAVVAADLSAEPREGGAPVSAAIVEAGGRCEFLATDVTRPDDLVAAVDSADGFGGLTGMVNCAGVFRRENFLEVTPEQYEAMFAVNVRGVFFGCQAAARAMRRRGAGGSIVNLASVASYRGSAGHATYHASKGAVASLTYALARDLAGDGIRVNAVHPGAVDTSMLRVDDPVLPTLDPSTFPMGRPVAPQDVADAVLYLLSPLSAHVSGTSLTVDGAAAAMG